MNELPATEFTFLTPGVFHGDLFDLGDRLRWCARRMRVGQLHAGDEIALVLDGNESASAAAAKLQ